MFVFPEMYKHSGPITLTVYNIQLLLGSGQVKH